MKKEEIVNSFMIEAVIIKEPRTGFSMITTSVMKELIKEDAG